MPKTHAITAPNEIFPSSSRSSRGASSHATHNECAKKQTSSCQNRHVTDTAKDALAPLRDRIDELRSIGSSGLALCLSVAPTAEGVLTAVGLSYLAGLSHAPVRLVRNQCAQPRLDEALLAIAEDVSLARRVYHGFGDRMRKDCLRAQNGHCPRECPRQCVGRIARIAASDDESMPEALYGYLIHGFSIGRAVFTHNAHPLVARSEELVQQVNNECEKARQFIRFSRLKNGAFHATYSPSANVIPLVAHHFARRMGEKSFSIVDARHDVCALYAKGNLGCFSLEHIEALRLSNLATTERLSEDEPYVRALWKRFYDALALPGRTSLTRGYDLRRSFMPKRLWQGLIELDPSVDDAWSVVPAPYQNAKSAFARNEDAHTVQPAENPPFPSLRRGRAEK